MSKRDQESQEPAAAEVGGQTTRAQLEFESPETAAVYAQIQEALDKGEFSTVVTLATRAEGLERKAKYDKDLMESQKKEIEKRKRAIVERIQNIKARYDLLIQDTDRNPFLNPDYKPTFDAIIQELQEIAGSESIRKKYDFEQSVEKLLQNLSTKLDRMHQSHLAENANENASMPAGTRISQVKSFTESLKEDLKRLKPEEMPWDEINVELAKFAY